MKQFSVILFIVFIQVMNQSCTKETAIVQPQSVSAITVVNALVGSTSIISDFNASNSVSSYYSAAQRIGYGSFYEFSIPSGTAPFTAFQISDTANAIFKTSNKDNGLLLHPATVYSLFLCGEFMSGSPADTVFTTDIIPFHDITDSSIGIRFINLSPGSNPVGVNIKGQATGSEVSNLPYKSITSYKNYPATYTVKSYTFEFHDMATDALLGTYSMSGVNNGAGNTSNNSFRFRNFTIVLKGLPEITSGPTAQGAFLVNNY